MKRFLSIILSVLMTSQTLFLAGPVAFALEDIGDSGVDSSRAVTRRVNTREKPEQRAPESPPPEEVAPQESAGSNEEVENTVVEPVDEDRFSRATVNTNSNGVAPVFQQPYQQPRAFTFDGPELIGQDFVDLPSGASTFRLPVAVPRGVNGLTPQLSLEYSSQMKGVSGPFGYGWGMRGSITRRNVSGVFSMYDPAKVVYTIDQGSLQGDLVKTGTGVGYTEYHLKREGEFARVRHITATDSWEVRSKDGMTTRYGLTDASKFRDSVGTRVFGWYPAEIEDRYGNTISYTWSRSNDALYPATVKWGGASGAADIFEVRYVLESRPDSRFSFATGFGVNYTSRVADIEVYVNNTKRFSYDLTYAVNSLQSRSDLATVLARGISELGVATDQLLTFGYYPSGTFHRQNLLKSITFPQGGIITYDYLTAVGFGGSNPNRYPFPMVSVNSVTRSDFTGRSDVTNYLYQYGYFFFESPIERMVAGYGTTQVTDPLGNVTKYYFHQGDGGGLVHAAENQDHKSKIGRMFLMEVYQGASTLLGKVNYKWEMRDLSNGRFFTSASQVLETQYPGGVSKGTMYDYNETTTGNITREQQFGAVNRLGDTWEFSDAGTDKVEVLYEYAVNTAENILAFPKQKRVLNQQGLEEAKERFYYDQLPLGIIDKGSLTKIERWWDTESRYVSEQATYNGNGNLLTTANARNKTTTYDFGTEQLYPVSVTNPKLHIVQADYDFMTGQMTRQEDPNSGVVETDYDGYGRPLQVRVSDPGNAGSLMVQTEMVYQLSQTPNSVFKRDHYDGIRAKDTYAFIDGFSRQIQVRTELEGSVSVLFTTYDTLGRVNKVFLPVFATGVATYAAPSASAAGTNYTYYADGRVLTETTPLGVTTRVYNGREIQVTDAESNRKDLLFDAYDQLVQVKEYNGTQQYVTTYAYTPLGLLNKIVNSEAQERQFSWDSLGNLTSAEDLHYSTESSGQYPVRSALYDDNGNVTQTTDGKGQVVVMAYDDLDRVLTESFNGGVRVTYRYDEGTAQKGQLTSVSQSGFGVVYSYNLLGQMTQEVKTIDGVSYTTGFSYDRQGRKKSMTYPDGKQVVYQLDASGTLDKVVYDGTEVVKRLDYHQAGHIKRADYGNGLSMMNTFDNVYRLDTRKVQLTTGLVVRSTWSPFAGLVSRASVFFNGFDPVPSASARAVNEDVPDVKRRTSSKRNGGTTILERIRSVVNTGKPVLESIPRQEVLEGDELRVVLNASDPDGDPLTFSVGGRYVPEGMMIEGGELVWQTDYEDEGRYIVRVFVEDLEGNKHGRKVVVDVEHANSPVLAALPVVVEVQQEPVVRDPLSISSSPCRVQGYQYKEPIFAMWPFEYDEGEVISSQIAIGVDRCFDELSPGLVVSVNGLPAGASFDSRTHTITWTPDYYSAGTFTSFEVVLDDQYSTPVRNTYSAIIRDVNGPPDFTVSNSQIAFAGEALSLSITARDPDSDAFTIAPVSLPSGATFSSTTTILSWTPGAGQIGSQTSSFRATDSRGNVSAPFDVTFTVTDDSSVLPTPSNIVLDLDYDYDAVGNVMQLVQSSAISNKKTAVYTYDDLYRLKTATITNVGSGQPYTKSLNYSSAGNITSKSDMGGAYTYEPAGASKINPQAVRTANGVTYNYDDNGDMVSDGTFAYVWNYKRQLVSATNTSTGQVATYFYDFSGQRYKKVVTPLSGSAETTVYVGGHYEVTPTGEVKSYVAAEFDGGASMRVATVRNRGGVRSVFYTHEDHLTGTGVVTNSSGQLVQVLDYAPFGAVTVDEKSASFDETNKFTGKELDEETGLMYFGARYYSASLGRWVSEDPMGWRIGELLESEEESNLASVMLIEPQYLNFYSYGLNNPLKYVDPTGEVPDPTDAIAGFCGPGVAICFGIKEVVEGFAIAAVVGLLASNAGNVHKEVTKLRNNVERMNISSGSGGGGGNGPWDKFKQALQKFKNTVDDHLTKKDLQGAYKDLVKDPVMKSKDVAYQHLKEVKDALTGLKNNVSKPLGEMLSSGNLSPTLRSMAETLKQSADDIISTVGKYLDDAVK
jgi:RHS repeat-associated protein